MTTNSSTLLGKAVPETSSTTRGQYLHAPKVLRVEERQLQSPAVDEVQIAIRSTTLCGSDLHYFAHCRNGSITVREPLCLGHEAAGDVVAVGSEVTKFQCGDKVAVECGVPCEECDLCLEGRYNLCPKLRFRSSGSAFPHYQGTLQQRINHPSAWTHKLPRSLSYDEGALLEPLAVAVHACRRAQIKSGSNCLILGAGAVGQLCALAARMEGCTNIAIADIDPGRVGWAIENKFAEVGHVIPLKRGSSIEENLAINKELATSLNALRWPNGSAIGRFQTTFECTGVPSCLQTAIYATKSGGKVLLVGMGTPNHTLPLSESLAREVELVPTWRYANCYQRAIEIVSAAQADPTLPQISKMITHQFKGLDVIADAFTTAGKMQDEEGKLVMKVAVHL